MPRIDTTRELVITNQQSGVQLSGGPGQVRIVVASEGVIHAVTMSPDEAVQVGVALIQLGGSARAAMQQMQQQANGNGQQQIVTPQ